MKKVLLTSAIIASLGTAAVAQGIAPVTTTSTNTSMSVGSLSQSQLVALAAALGITLAVLISVLDDETDAT